MVDFWDSSFFLVFRRGTRIGLALRKRFTDNFACGYVNAMLAAWVARCRHGVRRLDLALRLQHRLSGFQASVLVWLFLGVGCLGTNSALQDR